MEQEIHPFAGKARHILSPASVTLAFQHMRQTWRLLSLVWLGMLAAVIVVCATPLYARVAMTAGLRAALHSSSQGRDIVVQGVKNAGISNTTIITPRLLQKFAQSLEQEFQFNLGPYLLPAQFSWRAAPLNILAPAPDHTLKPAGNQMTLVGTDITQAAAHIRLEQGHLPGPLVNNNTIDVALLADLATSLQWNAGTVLPLQATYINPITGTSLTSRVNIRVVGVFSLPPDDPFWHGETFQNAQLNGESFIASALVSNDALTSLFTRPLPGQPASVNYLLSDGSTLLWYYSLDMSRIQIGDVDTILQRAQQTQINIANDNQLSVTPAIQRLNVFFPSSAFNLYHERLPATQFPINSLTALVLCLVVFFVVLMAGLLIERQSGSIALLRSRGATGGQIFWTLVTQASMLGMLALVSGPVVSVLLAHIMAQALLANANYGATSLVSGNPIPVALSVTPFALVAVCAMVLTMALATWGTANRDILTLRREAARSTHRPIWQRLHLDTVMILIALVGGAFAFYLTNSQALDTRLILLFLSPLTLLETLCVLLAAMLLLLRIFPFVLRAGAWVATHQQGSPALLALAQMARAPRQALRMTLLLSLATAFLIFALAFQASQTQRVEDVANYQAGADFSGSIPSYTVQEQGSLESSTQAYHHLPGVLSDALGYINQVPAGGVGVTINFQAVDANTFAQTVRWSPQYSTQPLAALMQQLRTARAASIRKGVIPAIVDTTTWNDLQLGRERTFTLNFAIAGPDNLITFQAIAEIQHIPSAGNSSVPGVLTDYQTFAGAYARTQGSSGSSLVPPNFIWLRSSDNPQQVNALRNALRAGDLSLTPLYDRRATASELASDPLYHTLFGVLLLGATIALLLALVGNLVASWLSARTRLSNFATLRALGATPRQIAATLAWEQSIIYGISLLLGLLFGWLLAALALPALIFTSVPPSQVTGQIDNATFFAEQSTPPVQIIVPQALWIVLGAFILLCILALSIMVWVVSRPSIAQVLRLNED